MGDKVFQSLFALVIVGYSSSQRSCSGEGSLRLVGGSSQYEGRVEICVGRQWGTVCDDLWDARDARVVCSQLQYSPIGSVAFQSARYGLGTGSIHLDDVQCVGNEARLLDCRHVTNHNCGHSEDASVQCAPRCDYADGDIRLRGGASNSSGRVEVCRNNMWGTVCDDRWDNVDAQVVCRQLGFPTHNAMAFSRAVFGAGTGSIVMDEVRCTGSEGRLVNCTHTTRHDCSHFEDASVRCYDPSSQCIENSIRLRGGSTMFEGRVEVCLGGGWGTVCDDGWSPFDGIVTCRQLGFDTRGAILRPAAFFGQGTGLPIVMDDVRCTSRESQLTSCSYRNSTAIRSCTHSEDAGIVCRPLCEEGALRLVGGVSPYEGRVEVCGSDGQWGTVCDDGWSLANTRVVCRQLNFTSSAITPQGYSRARYGAGVGTILLDDVRCRGSETRLIACTRRSSHNCGHSEDVGVRCSQCVENSIRLRGGFTMFEGRVEVCLGGQWGTVCDDGWSPFDGIVTCRQLGFNTQGAILRPAAFFGQGTGLPIAMDDVRCTSRESQLTSCSYRNSTAIRSCTHREDAGIVCRPPPPDPLVDVRISNITATTVSLRWTPSYQLHVTITRYEVRCSSSFPVLSSGNVTVWGNSTLSATVMGLEEYTRHTCCVSSVTSNGRSAQHCETGTTLEAAPFGPPLSFEATTLNSMALELTWNPPQAELRNGVIRQYVIDVVIENTDQSDNLLVDGRTLSFIVRSLRPSFTYTFSIRAITVAQGPSANVTLKLPEDRPSLAPVNFVAFYDESRPTTVQLAWRRVPVEGRNGIIIGYLLTVTDEMEGSVSVNVTVTELSYEIRDLMPNAAYNISVAGLTSVGPGPAAYDLVKTIQLDIAPAPQLGSISRRSAQEIEISWSAVVDDDYRITGYVVKYRPITTLQKRNAEDQAVLIETNETSLVISDLDPRITYGVSVAARNRAGLGNFTEEALTELYSNSRFQVHMSGAIVCIPWLSHNGNEKQKLILSALAAEISKSCSCPFSVNYIGRVKLSCGDGTTDRVILEGTIVALPETSEEELHKHLQSWVDTSPTLEVAGVQLTLVKCSTYLSDGMRCELEDPLPNVATSKLKNDGSSGSSVFLYSGVGVGVLVVLILACFTIGLVWAVRRKRRQMKIRRLTLMATSPTTPLPGDIVESKLDDVKFDFQDSDSHIYESPDDLFSQIASKSSGIGDYSNSFGKGEPYQVPQPGKPLYQKPSSAPVRNGPNGCQSSPVAHARGYDVPRGTEKKQLSHTDFLTKPKPVENVYEDAAGTRLEGKGSTASGGGRLLDVARTSCRTSRFSPGQRNAADPHGWKDEAFDEDQYIEMSPTV